MCLRSFINRLLGKVAFYITQNDVMNCTFDQILEFSIVKSIQKCDFISVTLKCSSKLRRCLFSHKAFLQKNPQKIREKEPMLCYKTQSKLLNILLKAIANSC